MGNFKNITMKTQLKESMKSRILFLSLSLFAMISANAQSFFNLGFEYVQNEKQFVNWISASANVRIDSVNKVEGKYAVQVIRTAKDSVSPCGLLYQQANYLYSLKGKKISFKSKINADFKNGEGKAYAFIQAIYFQSPEKNVIISGNKIEDKAGWSESFASYQMDSDYIPNMLIVGVLLEGRGEIIVDDAEIQIDDAPLRDVYLRKEALTKKEQKWIDQHAIPVLPEIQNPKKILRDISNVRIVGLGEGTHGSATIFEAKNTLAKMLIEEGGYTLFAIEDGPYWGEVLNQYVMGNTEKLPRLNMNVMYTNDVFMKFIEWLREYNKTKTHKVQIVGVDVTPNRNEGMFRELDTKTQKNFSSVLDSINRILVKATDYLAKEQRYQYMKMPLEKAEKALIANSVIEIRKWIDKNIADKHESDLLFLYTKTLMHYLDFSKTIRDMAMADNMQLILSQKTDEKMIYTAHNSHTANSIYSDSQPGLDEYILSLPFFENNEFPGASPYTGWYLKKYFGDSYYVIGTCFYEGTNYLPGEGKVFETDRANPGSFEYLLNMAKTPDYFLDIRSIKKSTNSETKWLQSKMLLRVIGASNLPSREFEIHDMSKEFDAIVFLKKSVAL